MTEDVDISIMACVPVDTSTLPDLGVPLPEITDLYTRETCQLCNDPIWVGPRQAIARNLSKVRVWTLCYLCATHAYQHCDTDNARLVDLGGGAGVEGSVIESAYQKPSAFHTIPTNDFPFTVEFFREDTQEVLWQQTVERAGVMEVPGFGGQGFGVGVRIYYPDGRVEVTYSAELPGGSETG